LNWEQRKKGKKTNFPRLTFVSIHAWAPVSPGLPKNIPLFGIQIYITNLQ